MMIVRKGVKVVVIDSLCLCSFFLVLLRPFPHFLLVNKRPDIRETIFEQEQDIILECLCKIATLYVYF